MSIYILTLFSFLFQVFADCRSRWKSSFWSYTVIEGVVPESQSIFVFEFFVFRFVTVHQTYFSIHNKLEQHRLIIEFYFVFNFGSVCHYFDLNFIIF